MNILYIEHYAGSPEMGMEFRPYYLAREWVKQGHKVTMIAGDYSHLRKKNPSVDHDMQKETIDGIDYFWLKTGEYSGNGVKRAMTMLRFCRKLRKWKKWIVNEIRPDVVISSSTYPIDSIPASKIVKKCKNAKHIHEVHDMWPATLIEIGGMPKWNPFVVVMQYGENYAYKHADAVVSLLEYSKDYMVSHGLKPEKFHCIPNGIVIEEWESPKELPSEHTELFKKLKEENKYIVGYFGGHALSNCLDTLVDAAKKMNGTSEYSDIHIVLVGDGVTKEHLMKEAEAANLTNISFLPPIVKTAVPTLTEYFDCVYIGAIDSPLYRFGVCMNKMFDGMMAGKPIIFAINAPPTLVERCGCGLIIKPEDADAIVDAIGKMRSMELSEREQMGRKGKEEVLNGYTYEKLAEKFSELF